MTDGIAGACNSSVRVPEEMSNSGMPPVCEVGSFHSEGVSPTVAAGASLAKDVNEVVMDSVPLLVAAKGGLLLDVAGAVPMAVAEVASSVDFAGMTFPAVTGVASPVNLAGMAFPAIVGEMSPAEIAGMVLLAVAGVVPPAEFSEKTFPAVAGAESLIVVEVASSTYMMEPTVSPSMCDPQSDCGSLIPDDLVTVPDVALFPENVKLGEPTEVGMVLSY